MPPRATAGAAAPPRATTTAAAAVSAKAAKALGAEPTAPPPAKRSRSDKEIAVPNLASIAAEERAEAHILSVKEWLEHSLRNCFGTKGFDQFQSSAEPYEVQPLDITTDSKGMTSHKAPWQAARCATAVQTTSMYEAGGNIFWLDWRRPLGEGSAIAGSPPRWSQVEEIAERWFSRNAMVGGPFVRKRIVFPVPLLVHAPSLDNVGGGAFNGSLEMLAGHIWVWGWARGLATALAANDMVLVAALWESALTPTFHLRVGMTAAEQAAATIADSELTKSKDKLTADSFLSFAQKCWVIFGATAGTGPHATTAGSKTSTLKALGVTFGGLVVSKSMLTAILYLSDRFGDKAISILHEIEYKHGRDVLTGAYTKLGRLGQLVAGTGLDMPPQSVADYFLEYLKFGLDYEVLQARDVTVEWLDKQRDGTPGAVTTVLGRRQLVMLVGSWVEGLKESSQTAALHTELANILPMFENYAAYQIAFPSEPAADPEADPEADSTLAQPQGTDGATPDDEDAVERVKRKFHNTASHTAINLLFDVMAGLHDPAIKDTVKAATSLKDANWMEAGALTPLRDLHRTLTAHLAMVQISGGPPAAEGRAMQKRNSDAGEEDADVAKARADTWKLVTALRRKFATFITVRAASAASYQTAYEKSSAFKTENLIAGEAHRVFLFSADLFAEAPSTPWVSPAVWSEAAAWAVNFVAQQRGPADLLCFFDGRSRDCRREIEGLTGECRHQTEIFMVYSPTHRLGRRVAWSGNNCEVCLASLPVSKTRLAAKDREGTFNAAGESSTHDTSYTGVQPVPWAGLPLLSIADKAKLLEQPQEHVGQPKQGVFDAAGGIPLFWQDRKPVSLWKKLFDDVQARCVVDLTPGAGLAARAALDRGIPYLGITRTLAHGQWLGSVCDRSALHATVTSGTALHNADLTGSIDDHFSDLLARIRDSDAAEDKEMQDDEF